MPSVLNGGGEHAGNSSCAHNVLLEKPAWIANGHGPDASVDARCMAAAGDGGSRQHPASAAASPNTNPQVRSLVGAISEPQTPEATLRGDFWQVQLRDGPRAERFVLKRSCSNSLACYRPRLASLRRTVWHERAMCIAARREPFRSAHDVPNVLGELAERMPPWPSRVSSSRDRTSGPRRERTDRRRRPVDLPDGAEVRVFLYDAAADGLSNQERMALEHALDRSLAQADAGQLVDAEEVLDELRPR